MFGGGFIEWMDLHVRPAGEGERMERIKTQCFSIEMLLAFWQCSSLFLGIALVIAGSLASLTLR